MTDQITIKDLLLRTIIGINDEERRNGLEIALYGDRVLDVGQRHIPDADLLACPHIAVPLADQGPDYQHPETLAQIAAALQHGDMRRRLDVVLGT